MLAGNKAPTTQYDLKKSLTSNDDIERLRNVLSLDPRGVFEIISQKLKKARAFK